MAYRGTFDCLWCGTAWTVRGPDDLEGWAQLCPACLGRAGANAFLRGRVRRAIADRAAAGRASGAGAVAVPEPPAARPAPGSKDPVPVRLAARWTFPDDWFLRRGTFEHGAIHDAAWLAELDMVTRWLDGLPLAGRILEPAAGTGFFSPLLAERGELHAFDADAAALELARGRLLAHGLRAHLHEADPWHAATPDGADALLAAFLLGRVRGAGLDNAAASLRDRLRPGGRLALVELLPDPAGGPPPGLAWTWHTPELVEAALHRAGFGAVEAAGTGRFFLTVSAIAR